MAITFTQERKKQTYLILVFVLIIFSILLVVWWGFLKEKVVPPSIILPVLISPTKEIDWQTLKNPKLEELQPFEEIRPLEEGIGRENPFIPY